jgi:hypothetical protein
MLWFIICLIESFVFGFFTCLVFAILRYEFKPKYSIQGIKKIKKSEMHRLIRAKGNRL